MIKGHTERVCVCYEEDLFPYLGTEDSRVAIMRSPNLFLLANGLLFLLLVATTSGAAALKAEAIEGTPAAVVEDEVEGTHSAPLEALRTHAWWKKWMLENRTAGTTKKPWRPGHLTPLSDDRHWQ